MINMQNKAIGENKKKEKSDRKVSLILNEISNADPAVGYQAGMMCPKCKNAVLDYDGLLNLVCPNCGVLQGGCFT